MFLGLRTQGSRSNVWKLILRELAMAGVWTKDNE